MTNKELRDILASYPDDMEVVFDDYNYGHTPIHGVETETVFDINNELKDVIVLSV